MVLLDRIKYDSFLESYINYIEAKQTPIDRMQKLAAKLEKITKHKQFLIIWKHKKQDAPACPRLFAYIKTHKKPVATRPIVERDLHPRIILRKHCPSGITGS